MQLIPYNAIDDSLPIWLAVVGNLMFVPFPIAYLLIPAVRARTYSKLFTPRSRAHVDGRAETRTFPSVLCAGFFLMAEPDWVAFVDHRHTFHNVGLITILVLFTLSLAGWFTTYWFAWPKWLVTKPYREDLSLIADWRSVRRAKRQRREEEL